MAEKPMGYDDLGWANGWSETPQVVKDCREKGHKVTDEDIGPPMRGIHNIVTCRWCGYIYHYDSSD